MLSLSPAVRIFLCTRITDMRCGFYRLAMLAETVLQEDPYSGHLFVFFNRRGDRCKVLYWDRTGFCLIYKCLEQGVFRLPCYGNEQERRKMDITDLSLILEGIELDAVHRRKRYTRVPVTGTV